MVDLPTSAEPLPPLPPLPPPSMSSVSIATVGLEAIFFSSPLSPERTEKKREMSPSRSAGSYEPENEEKTGGGVFVSMILLSTCFSSFFCVLLSRSFFCSPCFSSPFSLHCRFFPCYHRGGGGVPGCCRQRTRRRRRRSYHCCCCCCRRRRRRRRRGWRGGRRRSSEEVNDDDNRRERPPVC